MKIGPVEIRWVGFGPKGKRDILRWMRQPAFNPWSGEDEPVSRKINAIKKYRAKYNVSLKEAKDIVESHYRPRAAPAIIAQTPKETT